MKEVYTKLFIGDDNDCMACSTDPGFSIVHACQSCHQGALNYKSSLPSTHPSCLIYENGTQIYLNMVDVPYELQSEFTHPVFKSAMEFIHREIKTKNVLVHCNFGYSRSPSLGLVYLAINGLIPNKSLEKAAQEYFKLYPKYTPGRGITLYMNNNWDFLMNLLTA